MAKFIFNNSVDDCREASNIELEVPHDMDIWEYKTICIRMAAAMGYSPISIEKAFGKVYETDKSNEFKRFLSLISSTNEYSGSLIG